MIRFAQSYHSSCFDAATKEGDGDNKLSEFSDYINLSVDSQASGEEDSFVK